MRRRPGSAPRSAAGGPLLPAAAGILAAALLLAGCLADDRSASGTGSETTNHVAGVIYGDEDTPAAGVRVALVRADFDPRSDVLPDSRLDTTDARGAWSVEGVDTGAYQVEAYAPGDGRRALRTGVRVEGGGDRVDARSLRLETPGFLTLALPDSLRTGAGLVYIPGTTFRADAGGGATVTLGPLPPMAVPRVLYARGPGRPPVVLAESLTVSPGDTAVFPTAPSGEMRFRIDAAGAGITEDVHGFPLLVRLGPGDFADFAALPAGAPPVVAFRKPGGGALPFEVERWDAAAGRAEIWVRMDTVKAGAADREIVLAWSAGSPGGPAPRGDGAAVFDTAAGFAGVWHLGAAGGASGERPDATAFRREGKPLGYEGDEAAEGAVGQGDALDALDDKLELGDIDVAGPITLSAWVRPDPANPAWAAVLYKPFERDTLPWKVYALQYWDDASVPHFEISEGTNTYGRPFAATPAGAWSLLHGTWDGETLRTFLDGEPVAEIRAAVPALHRNDLPTFLGAEEAGGLNKFIGAVDEARIERVARSASWIRLSHRNQKPGSTVVTRVR